MEYSQAEILQTVAMTEMEHLDVRTVTLGLSLRDCAAETIARTAERAVEKIHRYADGLVKTVDAIADEFGIRVANKRIAITPVSMITESASGDPVELARAIDQAAAEVGVDFIGGYSALVHKGATDSEREFLNSIPEALSTTKRLCSSVNVATTRAGINMDALLESDNLQLRVQPLNQRFIGSWMRMRKRICCSSSVIENQYLTTVMPERTSMRSNSGTSWKNSST